MFRQLCAICAGDGIQGDGHRAVQRCQGTRHASFPHAAVELVHGGHILHLRRLPPRVRAAAPLAAVAIRGHQIQRLAVLLHVLLRVRRLRPHPEEGLVQISGTCRTRVSWAKFPEFHWGRSTLMIDET